MKTDYFVWERGLCLSQSLLITSGAELLVPVNPPGTKPLEWQNALAQVSTSGVHFRVGRGLEAEAGSELLGSSWTVL